MKPENTMKDYLILLLTLFACLPDLPARIQTPDEGPSFEGYQVTPKGAWCWFADPRALHHESKDGSIDKTYIGYIDVHGNIKAMQTDWKTNQKKKYLFDPGSNPMTTTTPHFSCYPTIASWCSTHGTPTKRVSIIASPTNRAISRHWERKNHQDEEQHDVSIPIYPL